MGLDAIIRSGIATAKSVTADLQDEITIEAYIGQDKWGAPSYATGVSYDALVEHKQRLVRDFNGNEVTSATRLTVLQPIAANGDADRLREPIDPRDKITLPDGTTHTALAEEGLVDPSTGKPFMHEIAL